MESLEDMKIDDFLCSVPFLAQLLSVQAAVKFKIRYIGWEKVGSTCLMEEQAFFRSAGLLCNRIIPPEYSLAEQG